MGVKMGAPAPGNRETSTMTLFESLFEINAAIVMLAVAIALFVWFRAGEASASARRMAGMLGLIGLDPAVATGGRFRRCWRKVPAGHWARTRRH